MRCKMPLLLPVLHVTHAVTLVALQGPHAAQGDTFEDIIDASALTAEVHMPSSAAPSLPPAFYIFFGALACAVAIAGKRKACCVSSICVLLNCSSLLILCCLLLQVPPSFPLHCSTGVMWQLGMQPLPCIICPSDCNLVLLSSLNNLEHIDLTYIS